MGADGDAESLGIWGNLGLLALTFAAEGHWMALLRPAYLLHRPRLTEVWWPHMPGN